MKRSALFISLLLYSLAVFPQVTAKKAAKINLLNDDGKWNKGSITLADGSEIKGLLKFNSRNGALFYNEGDNARPLMARSVLAFDFFDDSLHLQRTFYSIETEDPVKGTPTHMF